MSHPEQQASSADLEQQQQQQQLEQTAQLSSRLAGEDMEAIDFSSEEDNGDHEQADDKRRRRQQQQKIRLKRTAGATGSARVPDESLPMNLVLPTATTVEDNNSGGEIKNCQQPVDSEQSYSKLRNKSRNLLWPLIDWFASAASSSSTSRHNRVSVLGESSEDNSNQSKANEESPPTTIEIKPRGSFELELKRIKMHERLLYDGQAQLLNKLDGPARRRTMSKQSNGNSLAPSRSVGKRHSDATSLGSSGLDSTSDWFTFEGKLLWTRRRAAC